MVQVTSEVGRLRRALVHEPGPEVDRMVPSMMEELLFDDILYGERAREEHRRLKRLLQLLGVEVVEANHLLREALQSEEARQWLVGVMSPDLMPEQRGALRSASPGELVSSLVEGIRREGGGVDDLFHIPPLPNWCFQRDPQAILGDGVIFSAMATPARWREALLARATFRFHPDLAGTRVLCDPLEPAKDRPLFLGLHRPRLEGGDLLVLSRDVVAVGVSERTNTVGVSLLTRALAGVEGGPRWMVVVHLPARRAYMHLDTVFTPVDRDAALVFPPLLDGPERAQTFEVDLHAKEPEPTAAGGVMEALRRRGIDLEPMPCGGDDPLAQQREQWTDGANALAVGPGVIVLYDRNVRTAEMLGRRGFRLVEAESALLGREEISPSAGRTCFLLESNEISRARGGPHCLVNPLVRDEA